LGVIMDTDKDYFLCDNCKNKNFIKVYTFSIQFRKVNFSDDLIHDEIAEENYQCTHCNRTFSKHQIVTRLNEIKDKRIKSLDKARK
jgi:hypothetical protein